MGVRGMRRKQEFGGGVDSAVKGRGWSSREGGHLRWVRSLLRWVSNEMGVRRLRGVEEAKRGQEGGY